MIVLEGCRGPESTALRICRRRTGANMHEILAILPPGSTVLDLGSGGGSFDRRAFPLTVVRADLAAPPKAGANFAVSCASRLPFADRSFGAVILNHSLEHFENLTDSVGEIARILADQAFLYIAVPDASTWTDRTYRWLSRGGGHINLFSDATVIPQMITAATGLKHAGTRVLCTSFSFLNRRNIVSRPPRKLVLFLYGHEGFLRGLNLLLRCLDHWFHWRTSVYGWAFYFGDVTPDCRTWSNVCVRCGSGHPSSLLKRGSVTYRPLLPSVYACPQCGTRNFLTDDEDFRALR